MISSGIRQNLKYNSRKVLFLIMNSIHEDNGSFIFNSNPFQFPLIDINIEIDIYNSSKIIFDNRPMAVSHPE